MPVFTIAAPLGAVCRKTEDDDEKAKRKFRGARQLSLLAPTLAAGLREYPRRKRVPRRPVACGAVSTDVRGLERPTGPLTQCKLGAKRGSAGRGIHPGCQRLARLPCLSDHYPSQRRLRTPPASDNRRIVRRRHNCTLNGRL